MDNAPTVSSVSFQDILNENDDAVFLLDAILMMTSQIEDAEHSNALITVARITKDHLRKVEELVDAMRKGAKQ
ncbi:hypothetical protein DNK03_08180 [Brucella anthropi]|uniref:hypothetical protein n=1 Tax=Brucella anthropi TaxID=529 RepID=UPI000DECF5F0|nr:hypothetical protein [Brucella anthropi]RCI79534.1 hypothetical protein DNK03_08180 [Brucella anthropi]